MFLEQIQSICLANLANAMFSFLEFLAFGLSFFELLVDLVKIPLLLTYFKQGLIKKETKISTKIDLHNSLQKTISQQTLHTKHINMQMVWCFQSTINKSLL